MLNGANPIKPHALRAAPSYLAIGLSIPAAQRICGETNSYAAAALKG